MNLVRVRAGTYQRCPFFKNCCMEYSLLNLYFSMPWLQTTHGSKFQFILFKKVPRTGFLLAVVVAPESSGFCLVPLWVQIGSLSRLTCSISSSELRLLLSSSEMSSSRTWLCWASLASVSPRILSSSFSSFSSFCICLCSSSARNCFCCSNSAWIRNLCVSTFPFGVNEKREVVLSKCPNLWEWMCPYPLLLPGDSPLWLCLGTNTLTSPANILGKV